MLRGRPATWAGLQAVCALSLLAVCHGGIVTTPGVVPPSDKCWPYSSDVARSLLFNRQLTNQKAFYRTAESYWCANTAGLVGKVLRFEQNVDYYIFDEAAVLVRVQWNNGVVGLHRMGVAKKYDLDTDNVTSDILATYSLPQLQGALARGTVVRPTLYMWPRTDWLEVCNVGLTAASSKAFGKLRVYPGAEFVSISWTSPWNSSLYTLGFQRYGNGHFDVCFSGCSSFRQFRLADFARLFPPCALVAPSPTMLQALANSEHDVASRYIIVPPYMVGIELIVRNSYQDLTYDHPLLPLGAVFVDVTRTSVCLFNYTTCPSLTNMHITDLQLLMPIGSIVSSAERGAWSGTVVWTPGTVITDKEAYGTNSSRIDNMGNNGSFDFCLDEASPYGSICPPKPEPTFAPTNASSYGPLPPTDAPPTPGSELCTFDIVATFYTVFVPLSAICILYLAFRRPGNPFRFNMRPSSVVPVNLFDLRVDRALVAVAYGATVQIVYLMVTGELNLHIGDANTFLARKWLGIAITILMTLVIGFTFYVVFAAITTPHQPEGVMMGLTFSILFITFYSLRLVSCPIDNRTVNILQAVPAYFCLGVLVLYFSLRLVRYILAMSSQHDMETLVARYQFGKSTARELPYLKALLKRNFVCEQKVANDKAAETGPRVKVMAIRLLNIVGNFLRYNFPIPTRKDTFSYSPLYLTSVSMGLITVYMLVVSIAPIAVLAIAAAHRLAAKYAHISPIAVDMANVLPASLITSLVVASSTVVLHCLHMLRCYKRHMLRLYRGDDSFMTRKFPKPINQLKAYGRFLGTQTGYIFFGFFIMFLSLLLVILIVAVFVALMKYIQYVRNLFYNYVLIGAATAVIVFLVIHMLVGATMDRKESVKYGVLRHRATYHNLVYFFVFYNVVLGFISVLVRMVIVAIFNAIMVIRLNRPLMPRGWEWLDFSYSAYCGYLRLEMAHTHPCMLAFVALAKDEVNRPLRSRTSKAARRWALAYTLVRNPELIPLRAQFVNTPRRKLDASMLARSLSTGADNALLLNYVHFDELVESASCDSVNTARSDVELLTAA